MLEIRPIWTVWTISWKIKVNEGHCVGVINLLLEKVLGGVEGAGDAYSKSFAAASNADNVADDVLVGIGGEDIVGFDGGENWAVVADVDVATSRR